MTLASHREGFVHSDIRKENLLFDKESDQTWMIDFGLAGKEGTPDPTCFNHRNIPVEECHPDAKATRQRRKHDRHALSVILDHYFGPEDQIEQTKSGLLDLSIDLIELASQL